MSVLFRTILFSYALAAAPTYAEEAMSFQSGTGSVAVIELFTSQGCSSCPPAERWLGSLSSHPELWESVIPMAFHVDYWDRLGWKDPFASRDNTQRQYAYAKAGGVRSVYTPCMILNGQEWRGWRSSTGTPPGGPLKGNLVAELAKGKLTVRSTGIAGRTDLHIAVLGFGLETKVTRGENRNRTLKQDFTVLAHERHAPADGTWAVGLPELPASGAPRLGLAVWVSRADDPAPLQAAGGWLPGPAPQQKEEP